MSRPDEDVPELAKAVALLHGIATSYRIETSREILTYETKEPATVVGTSRPYPKETAKQ